MYTRSSNLPSRILFRVISLNIRVDTAWVAFNYDLASPTRFLVQFVAWIQKPARQIYYHTDKSHEKTGPLQDLVAARVDTAGYIMVFDTASKAFNLGNLWNSSFSHKKTGLPELASAFMKMWQLLRSYYDLYAFPLLPSVSALQDRIERLAITTSRIRLKDCLTNISQSDWTFSNKGVNINTMVRICYTLYFTLSVFPEEKEMRITKLLDIFVAWTSKGKTWLPCIIFLMQYWARFSTLHSWAL